MTSLTGLGHLRPFRCAARNASQRTSGVSGRCAKADHLWIFASPWIYGHSGSEDSGCRPTIPLELSPPSAQQCGLRQPCGRSLPVV